MPDKAAHSRAHAFIRDVIIPAYWNDTEKANELTPKGSWRRRAPAGSFRCRAQFYFCELAEKGYAGTLLSDETGAPASR